MNREFVALDFPLNGRRLIEASAGTGKTYNIANLYLRLLLGDNCKPATVEQILVVTFTRAATNELRGRIRDKIEQALQVFRGQPGSDDFINQLLTRQHLDTQQACHRLNNALVRMDESSIFTIHGFAVRAIQVFLFETGALADVEISESGNARRDLLLADVWRQLQLTDDATLKSYTEALGFSDREKFSGYFSRMVHGAEILPTFAIRDVTKPLSGYIQPVERYVADVIAGIMTARQALLSEWNALVKKCGTDVIKSSLGDKGNSKLYDPIEKILQSDITDPGFPGGKAYERLMHIYNAAEADALSVFIRKLVAHVRQGRSRATIMGAAFRALLLQYLTAKMQETDLSAMQLDEVIRLINQTLSEGGARAKQLRNMITAAYPVCMVDEFQDTDPAQFEMFNELYKNTSDTAFFMIGDPKQSIYQFRGADIFSYLRVRAEVEQQQASSGEQHIFSLDTNFRSKQALIDATNCLFRETLPAMRAPTFVFPGMGYSSVKSCEAAPHHKNKGNFSVSNKQLAAQPLVFVGNGWTADSADKINGDSLRWRYAHDSAQRIAALLNPDSGGKIDQQVLRGGDVAVLVRTGREANAVRAALLAQQPRIGSVYQSQKDSVFGSSLIAEDIYHLLCAMDDPRDKKYIKNAMVTLLYRGFELDFASLDALESNDMQGQQAESDLLYEQLIAEFDGYRQQWENYGVLTALDQFCQQHGLLQKIARLPDGDRLVTDLRHLGEILQKKYLDCSSREELIVWYARQLKDDSEMEEDAKRIRLESDDNLVKIVTIHVAKGLEYPVVFVPFFFLPWTANTGKQIPLYHPADRQFSPVVDFAADTDSLEKTIQNEMLAEDMRLLYVAITRAVFQCYIGISAATLFTKPLFHLTVWQHLLPIDDQQAVPEWPVILQALRQHFGDGNTAVAYQKLFDCKPEERAQQKASDRPALLDTLALPALPISNWVITSYSALAHAGKEPGRRQGGADEIFSAATDSGMERHEQVDAAWAAHIRYRLKGSNRTGDCLHAFYEQLALDPHAFFNLNTFNSNTFNSSTFNSSNNEPAFESLLQDSLRRHGLESPEGIDLAQLTDIKKEQLYAERRQQLMAWFNECLHTPLLANQADSSLYQLFMQNATLPELAFDFSIGTAAPARINDGINAVLRTMGIDGISVPYRAELEGLVTGSMDLLFIHHKKIYVLDYKSNTLGKAPRFYDRAHMTQAMQDNRFDLQYLIYSVAAHRYMQQRLGQSYDFDAATAAEYSFGGVLYLFLRGMGLQEYPEHGIWFHRPHKHQIEALDAALRGAVSAGSEVNRER